MMMVDIQLQSVASMKELFYNRDSFSRCMTGKDFSGFVSVESSLT